MKDTMQAAVYTAYGPPEVVRLETRERPRPGPDEVLIRVVVTTVSTGDWRLRSMDVPAGFGWISRLVFGIRKPRQTVLGSELSGEVVAIGKRVRKFAEGDRVFAFNGARMGAHAEYAVVTESGPIARVPASLSMVEAAALSFGGTTALDFFRRAALQAGDKVLVVGASGAVGSAAVQIAKAQGAHVTAVCSASSAQLVRSLGAENVIDYAREQPWETGQKFDVVMDTVGTVGIQHGPELLHPGGRLLLVFARFQDVLLAPLLGWRRQLRVIAGPAAERAEDVATLAQMADNRTFRPLIDRVYPFAQIVAAHHRVDEGHKHGSVAVLVNPEYWESTAAGISSPQPE